MKYVSSLAAIALFAMLATGCSNGSNASSTAATSSTTTGAAGDAYPDWAAAVVPAYPNLSSSGPVTSNFYQLETPDAPPVVLAWYKAHLTGGTWAPVDPDGNSGWNATAGKIRIHLEANSYPGTDPAMKKPLTLMIVSKSP